MGEAIADEDDEDVNVQQLFKDAQRVAAAQQMQDPQGEGRQPDDESLASYDDDAAHGSPWE